MPQPPTRPSPLVAGSKALPAVWPSKSSIKPLEPVPTTVLVHVPPTGGEPAVPAVVPPAAGGAPPKPVPVPAPPGAPPNPVPVPATLVEPEKPVEVVPPEALVVPPELDTVPAVAP